MSDSRPTEYRHTSTDLERIEDEQPSTGFRGFIRARFNDVILIVTVIALVGIVVYWIDPDMVGKNYVYPEVFRLNYQFLLIVVVGGIVSVKLWVE